MSHQCRWMLSLVALLGLLLPAGAHAAHQPRAAVTFIESADQPTDALKSLRALLEEQLEQHSIKVVRKPAPPLVTASPKQIKPYAKARRLDRIYDVRLRPQGEQLEVVLTERRAPSMRSTFSAKLSAKGLARVQKAIPRLVGAVVARAEPEPEEEAAAAAATPQVQAQPSASAPPPAVTAAGESKRGGEFLVGASADLGTLLRSPAGLFGGSAKLFYQWTSLRIGAELGGAGGQGTAFHVAARSEYVFLDNGFSPYVGAGIGFLSIKDTNGSGGGGGYFAGGVGLEYSRWRKVHLTAEAEVSLPFFSATRDEITTKNGRPDFVVVSAWSPAILFKLGCLY